MTAEINSLKKARSSTTTPKPTKQKAAASKTQVNKKAQPKKTKEQKKKTNEKWAWKNKPPKDTDSKENNAFVKTFEGKSIIGACTTIMERACGPYITPTTVRQAKRARHHPPTLTSLPSTLWIAILNENDYCARTKCLFGSG